MADDNDALQLGAKVKQLREDKGQNRDDLARNAGLASEELARIEDGKAMPPLGDLIKLAKALGVKIGSFFDEESDEPFCLVRHDQRKATTRFAPDDGESHGYSYESLGFSKTDRKMEPFVVTLRPDDGAVDPNQHVGEEFIYVLEGEVKVVYGNGAETLGPGDSIYYNANVPHAVSCANGEQAKIVAVIHAYEDPIIF